MNYVIDHVPKTRTEKRPGLILAPTTITLHNTANPTSTARNERNYLTNVNNTAQTSFHIVVDEKEAIECIPLNEVAWAAGDGRDGKGNRTSIHIEICESGDYQKTLENTLWVLKRLFEQFGWTDYKQRIRKHNDWSGKNCPRLMNLDGKWTEYYKYIERIENYMRTDEQVAEWAKEAMEWAIKEGLTDGTRPKEQISLERFITILYRYHNKK